MLVQVRGRRRRAGAAVAPTRLGILGGVFNPPHVGHLICAQEAMIQLGLEEVVLVPAGEPAHRTIEDDPGAEARFEMCERATAGDERLSASKLELERPGPSWTVDTVRELRRRRPEDELYFIIGGDEAAVLWTWREPEEILRLVHVAVAEREGRRREEIAAELDGLRGAERIHFFDMPRIDVSSSLIRERARHGLPIRYLVPDAVAEHVREGGLYRPPVGVGAP